MIHYPGFDLWYESRRNQLQTNKLARYFVDLRNYMQEVGGSPVAHTGTMKNGEEKYHALFMPTNDLKNTPPGGVVQLATEYYIDILKIVKQCYVDFAEYVDPWQIFTTEGLSKLGWTVEDLEESCGLPRGWTYIEEDFPNKTQERLNALKREFQKEEEMDFYFKKYNL
jgi:hypothetical protein